MARLDLFCDLRNNLQFLVGVYLMFCGVSIVVDLLVIAEVAHFYIYWTHETLRLSPATADLVMTADIIIIALQIFYGLQLFTAVPKNAYSKIQVWIIPSAVMLSARLMIVIFYIYSMHISPFYFYFLTITIFYSVFLFWPVRQFLCDFGTVPTTENSRLLGRVN